MTEMKKKKMKFDGFSYVEVRDLKSSPVGSRFKDENKLVQEGNNYRLEKVGQIDIQEQIASYADGVDLKKMIQRFKRGDSTALDRKRGFYADVSSYPSDTRSFIDAMRSDLSKNGSESVVPELDQSAQPADNISENGKIESEVKQNETVVE